MHRHLVMICAALFAMELAAQEPPSAAPAWKKWKGAGCSVTYPSQWTVDESGEQRTVVVLRSPLDSADTFQENVNLIVQDLDSLDLAGYVTITENSIRAALTDGRIITSADGPGAQAHSFEYAGELNGRKMHWLQVVHVSGDHQAYLLTYTAPQESFDEFRYVAEAMLNSFTSPR